MFRKHGGVIRKAYDNRGRGVAFEREGKLYFLTGRVKKNPNYGAPLEEGEGGRGWPGKGRDVANTSIYIGRAAGRGRGWLHTKFLFSG